MRSARKTFIASGVVLMSIAAVFAQTGDKYELTGGVLDFEAERLFGGNFELTGIVRPPAAWTTPAKSGGGFELALVAVTPSQIGPGDGVPTRADRHADADLDHPLVGDLDADRVIDMFDLIMLLDVWGPCGDCEDCLADLDGDCSVGATDLLMLLGNWG